ncbi:MAG: hypothetical protein KDN22_32065, partial [Verrucomicrobiae bacterium]|nr:hypothetical protein [Verrucomicrobiae bacterium]
MKGTDVDGMQPTPFDTWVDTGYTRSVYTTEGKIDETFRGNESSTEWEVYDASYADGELQWTEDGDGVRTDVDYDSQGRLLKETKKGASYSGYVTQADIVTDYSYSGYGQAGCGGCDSDVTVTVNNLGGANRLQSGKSVDSAGYPYIDTDQNGYSTYWASPVYQPSVGVGLKEVITYPSGRDEELYYYPDGHLKNITGDGVTETTYTYTVETSGNITEKIFNGSSSSPRWTATERDWAGRTAKVSRSGYGDTVVDTYYYNTQGQLTRIAHGPASLNLEDTVFSYDALGDSLGSGIDLTNNNVLVNASADRVTEAETFYET